MLVRQARSLAELPAFSGLRLRLAVDQARRDSRGTTWGAERLGFPVLSENDDFAIRRDSSTFFILGSGPSVEELTSAQWEYISRNTSVGINSWVLHDFVADIYAFEEVKNREFEEVVSVLSRMLERPEILARAPQILILRPHSTSSLDRVVNIPTQLEPGVRIYGRTTYVTRLESNLEVDLTRLFESQRQNILPASVLIDAGMSVSRLVSLGSRLGFRRLVLVGVDLQKPQYFFEENPSYLSRRGVLSFNPSPGRGSMHDTEETMIRTFAASVVIPKIGSAVKRVFGSEIFVSSKSSALSSSLPIFEWP